jgi:hypothetical protein
MVGGMNRGEWNYKGRPVTWERVLEVVEWMFGQPRDYIEFEADPMLVPFPGWEFEADPGLDSFGGWEDDPFDLGAK